MANKIHEIFDLPEIDGIRASASSVPTFQEIQFVAPKNNHSRHREGGERRRKGVIGVVVEEWAEDKADRDREDARLNWVTIQDGAGIRQISSPSQGLSTPNCRGTYPNCNIKAIGLTVKIATQ
eukprot:295314-Amorphochlora_amoeboformis.AAC.1